MEGRKRNVVRARICPRSVLEKGLGARLAHGDGPRASDAQNGRRPCPRTSREGHAQRPLQMRAANSSRVSKS